MEALISLIPLIAVAGIFGLWVWSLIDILRSDFEGSGKIVWLLVVFFLYIFGSFLYFLIGRKQKVKKVQMA